MVGQCGCGNGWMYILGDGVQILMDVEVGASVERRNVEYLGLPYHAYAKEKKEEKRKEFKIF
jgi:hypothetical protein